MRRIMSVVLTLGLAFYCPAFISSVSVAADDPATNTLFHTDSADNERGIDSRIWDESSEAFVSQRLRWAPLAAPGTIEMQYYRDDILVLDSTFTSDGSMAVWEATVAGNVLRIERSISGMMATNEFLRVYIDGQLVPAYGDWFMSTFSNFAALSPSELHAEFLTESWVADALGRLFDPDRFRMVTQEFSDLIALWQSMIDRYDSERGDGGWSCVWCTVGVIGHLAAVGLTLAVGAPTGGLALAFYLIARYAGISATIATCVACGEYIKETLDNRHVEGQKL